MDTLLSSSLTGVVQAPTCMEGIGSPGVRNSSTSEQPSPEDQSPLTTSGAQKGTATESDQSACSHEVPTSREEGSPTDDSTGFQSASSNSEKPSHEQQSSEALERDEGAAESPTEGTPANPTIPQIAELYDVLLDTMSQRYV